MQIIIKEPTNWQDFEPFSATHLVCEIRCGAFRLFEKVRNLFPEAKIIFDGEKKKLNAFLKREGIIDNEIKNNTPTIEIDGNVLLDNDFLKYINNGGNVVNYQFKRLNYLWDAIKEQSNQIIADAKFFDTNPLNVLKQKNITLINENNIKIGKDVIIQTGCILDATDGVIIIDNNAKIMYNSVIIGPCYIGKNTTIKIAAKIYPNCSFGNYCKVGGEVEDSIFHNYSNKQHDGFVGHSYIGEWVNLGADTNTSDLKNNYSKVRMQLPHKLVNTNEQFIGTIFGDHTKTAINTSLNTGTIIGTATMIATSNNIPKYIENFKWLNNKEIEDYDVEKAINTMKIVMSRRNKILTDAEEILFRSLAIK